MDTLARGANARKFFCPMLIGANTKGKEFALKQTPASKDLGV